MKSNDKVIPIFGAEESEEDKKLNAKMKKEFLEVSDKEAERLLNDPALKDITAPDDMIGKIMDELKAQGKLRTEDMVAEAKRPENQNAVDELSDEDRESLLLGRRLKASGASMDDVEKVLECPPDECNDDGRNHRNSPKNKKRNIDGRGRSKGNAKKLAVGIAGFIILVGGSIVSIGQEYVSNIVAVVTERIHGSTLSIGNYIEDGESVTAEELAYQDVFKTIDVNPINFIYLPEELAFFKYDIYEDENLAEMRYGDGEKKMVVVAEKMVGKINTFVITDGVEIKKVDSPRNNLSISVYDLDNMNDNLKTYTAYFNYENNFYVITSNCDIDTFILILEKVEIKR